MAPKAPSRSGKKWSAANLNFLKANAETKTTFQIADYLNRTEAAVRAKAHSEGISLKPID